MSTRLYIGGLPSGTTAEELAHRFHPFGEVESCELVPSKIYKTRGIVEFPRNFGYVSLLPKDEGSIPRAVRCYNGSKWKGALLRCQIAQPTMMDIIQREKSQAHQASNMKASMPTAQEGATLYIRKPYMRRLIPIKLGGGKAEQLFSNEEAPSSPHPHHEPTLSIKRSFEEHLRIIRDECLQLHASPKEPRPLNPAPATNKKDEKRNPEMAAALKLIEAMQPRRSTVAPLHRNRVVDFLSSEDMQPKAGAGAMDLCRFDSDNEEEERDVPLKKTAAVPFLRIPQVDGALDDDSMERESGSGSEGNLDGTNHHPNPEDTTSSSSSKGTSASGDPTAYHDIFDNDAEDAENLMVGEQNNPAPEEQRLAIDRDQVPSWIAELLPAGASFYRQDPLVQIEAAWRAGKEAATREYKERRRQALRRAGRLKNSKKVNR